MTPLHILPTVMPDCDICSLNAITVPGYGTPGNIVLVGEAPGRKEIISKKPFVGTSGTLLRRTLIELGVDPENDCYLTNTCLCQPPGNRNPSKHEVKCCNGRLINEIELAKPKILILLGSIASQAFTGQIISKTRSRFIEWRGIPTICTYHPAYILRNLEAYRDFEFDLIKAIKGPEQIYEIGTDGIPIVEHTVLTHYNEVSCELGKLRDYICLDIETSSRTPRLAKIGPIGFTDNPDHVFIIPEYLTCTKAVQKLLADRIAVAKFPYRARLSKRLQTITHHAGYEWSCFNHSYGFDMNIDHDTMLMHYMLDERSGGGDDTGTGSKEYHSLKTLGMTAYNLPNWSDIMAPYRSNYLEAPSELLHKYLAVDVSVTMRLFNHLCPKTVFEGFDEVLTKVMYPAIKVVSDMTMNGVRVDVERLKILGIEWDSELQETIDELEVLVGREVNINSHTQVATILFDDLGLPQIDHRHTNKIVIARLLHRFDNPELQLIDSARRKKNIMDTWSKGITRKITEDDRLHTSFLLHGTTTGRLSSRQPNLQNVPKRQGPAIRNVFIASEGYELLEVDFKQLEVCVGAFLSNDETLIRDILDNKDIHLEAACIIYDCKAEDVTTLQRDKAKEGLFSIWYGKEPKTLMAELGITLEEVTHLVTQVHQRFPGIMIWKRELVKKFLEDQYVNSFLGRRRRYPLLTREHKHKAIREAVNHPIQSLASDITQMAGARVWLKHDRSIVSFLLTVHDSWLLEVKEGHMIEQARWIKEEMEAPQFPSPVPFRVSLARGYRWGSLEKFEV